MGGDELGIKIGRTQAAANVIGDALLGAIKKLGTNPSNADREFILRMLPQVNQDPDAIRLIHQYLIEKALFAQEELNARSRWLDENDDLSNYVPPQAQRLNDLLAQAGVDTSVHSTRPNPQITSVGRVPVATVKEDLTGPQINQMNTIINNKGGNQAAYNYLIQANRNDKITDDQAAILLYLHSLIYGAE